MYVGILFYFSGRVQQFLLFPKHQRDHEMLIMTVRDYRCWLTDVLRIPYVNSYKKNIPDECCIAGSLLLLAKIAATTYDEVVCARAHCQYTDRLYVMLLLLLCCLKKNDVRFSCRFDDEIHDQ